MVSLSLVPQYFAEAPLQNKELTVTIQTIVTIAHASMRESIEALIEKHTDMELMEWDIRRALDFSDKPIPDLLVMDIDRPWLKGIEMIGKILLGAPEMKLLALSMHSNRQLADEAIRAGASGYLLKDRVYEELFPAINAVVAGRIYMSPGAGDGYSRTDSDAPGLSATVKKRTQPDHKFTKSKGDNQ